jgi:glycosyltransferase involved in cell wall biosynthesis
MNDGGKHYAYPRLVRAQIAQDDLSSYQRAATFLNSQGLDALSIQHEYGIYGGTAGSHLLTLMREVRMPVVTTLHTVLSQPNDDQGAVMGEVLRRSERVVVMSAHGAGLLAKVHGLSERKIDLIPHGIPSVPLDGRSKDRLGLADRPVILTFGLLAPDKGIEFVIEAMPEIIKQFPEAVYLVLGATHPHVRAEHGETSRLGLEALAHRLGVGSNVFFHNRFVTLDELTEYLAAADIYITPYLNAQQITSGTLAYAVGSGKAVISTPYLYAQELLAQGRGVLVPYRDPTAIAQEVTGLLADEPRRLAMSRRAADLGRGMVWPAVAQSYMASFTRARAECHIALPMPVWQNRLQESMGRLLDPALGAAALGGLRSDGKVY